MAPTDEFHDVTRRITRVEQDIRPSSPHPRRPNVPQSLADRMAILQVPGVSIAVIADGRVDWARGHGVRQAGRPAPVTPETLFQAASISKPITALAVMRLVDDGTLHLDEDVNRYLTSWRVPANDGWQPRLTLRHLLSHTGGTTVHGFPGYGHAAALPTVRQILDGEAPANTGAVRVNGLPGVQVRYSGGGTTIVQQLLEDTVGLPFPTLMHDLVLQPLGMSQSTYEQPLPANRHADAAVGHRTEGSPANPRRVFQHGLENWLKLARRARNDLEHL